MLVAVVAVGINERDVSLDVFERERHYRVLTAEGAPDALRQRALSEAVVLSTCLRTEVYAVVERFHDGLADIERFFRTSLEHYGDRSARVSELLSCWIDEAAVSHLFEVAAGIYLPVLGEGEILRQVRTAAELARREQAAGRVSGRCSVMPSRPESVYAARPRSPKGTTSLAHAAVALAAGHPRWRSRRAGPCS